MTKRNVLYGNKEMYKKDRLKRYSRLHLEKKKIATLILNMILVLVSRQMVGSEKIFSIRVWWEITLYFFASLIYFGTLFS